MIGVWDAYGKVTDIHVEGIMGGEVWADVLRNPIKS